MSGAKGALWLGYPQTFTDGDDCTDSNEWCSYPEAHSHGFGCDETCPCRVDPARWVYRAAVPRAGDER